MIKRIWTEDVVADTVRMAVRDHNYDKAAAIIEKASQEHEYLMQGHKRTGSMSEENDVSIAEIPTLSPREVGMLERAGYIWLSEIAAMSEPEYREIEFIGPKMAKKIDEAVVKFRRLLFKASFGRCAICGDDWRQKPVPCLDVHEIARGMGIRAKSWRDRRAWLVVCRWCHEEVGNAKQWPLERQLALKMVCDGDHYDLDWFNSIRTGCRRVFQQDVDAWMNAMSLSGK